MKRTVIGCVIACVAMLAPAVADASKKQYAGSIEPSGEISFTLRKQNGKLDVLKLAWTNLPVDCNGEPNTTSGKLSFAVPVKDHKFKARAVLGDPQSPEARAVIKGELKGKRHAEGTIEVNGSHLPTDDGGSGNCESGRLDWSASH
jgi:hypothetical protein